MVGVAARATISLYFKTQECETFCWVLRTLSALNLQHRGKQNVFYICIICIHVYNSKLKRTYRHIRCKQLSLKMALVS